MRRFLFFTAAFVFWSLGYVSPLPAEEQPRAAEFLKLDQVLRLALKNSPEVKKVDAELAEKLASATEAQLPENPELEAEARIPREKASDLRLTPSYEFKLTQPFRLSHLGMRQSYAAALKHTARLEQQADLLRVLNETTLLYYRLWMLQQREKLLADSEQQAREVTERIAEAVEKQGTPSTEGNLFKAEAIRFGVELKATQAERAQAQMDLLAAIGSPWKEIRLEQPLLASIPQDRFKLTGFAQTRANLQHLVEQRQRAAARRYDVARMDIFPELSIRGIYERSDDGNEEAVGAGVLVRVPLWDFNQAEIKRSKAEKAVAEAEAQALDRMSFDRIVETRMKRAVALQIRAEAYWNDVLPAYQKSYELSRHQFEQGQASMLQLWQVQQKVSEAVEKALSDTAEALAARTLLEQALGGRIEEIP
jgi:outer membrane protein TolC